MSRWKDKRRRSTSVGLRPYRKLDSAPLRGRFLFTSAAIAAAEQLLPTYRGRDGDHEGIAFLLGREFPSVTIFTTALAPTAEHSAGSVFCDPAAISAAQTAARGYGLGLLAQVHSHPGYLTEHSEGDDDLVLMPFEGMLSLVVPHYGHFGMTPLSGLGVHQYQDGRWVAVNTASVDEGFGVLPEKIDLR
ncbi:MAG: Mov34/MPN/PAD-1 family protein [Thermomicrobiales bacterium]